MTRSGFIRQQLALVLEQYRRHPKPEAQGSFARCQNGATSASCFVAGGSTAALICDTGALLDYLPKTREIISASDTPSIEADGTF